MHTRSIKSPSTNLKVRCLAGVGGLGLVPVRQLNLSAAFFRQILRCAFLPLGGGGTRIARRIASSNLIGRLS
jgi:hypothetical protein